MTDYWPAVFLVVPIFFDFVGGENSSTPEFVSDTILYCVFTTKQGLHKCYLSTQWESSDSSRILPFTSMSFD